MQPHESGALCGCTARCTARESDSAMHSARERQAALFLAMHRRAQRERAPKAAQVITRVPLVLEASYELYSDACGYSQRYNERVVCASINILDYGSSAFGFERSFGCFCHLSLCRFAAGTHRREDLSARG